MSPRIVIVGAGFGGIAAAVALTEAGLDDVVILERADRAGGVWRDNTYPGCACDIPAPLYSYSFAPHPRWSRRFPPHHEIRSYIETVARDKGLTIRFGADVEKAAWDGEWRISLRGGETITADVLIPAVGQLSRPAVPFFPGAGLFAGTALHTARWDPGMPIDGRRIGVIGTGASAIQLVPAIAGRAAEVTVFQRHAPWTLPKPDRRYGAGRRIVYGKFPGLLRLPRAGVWAMTWVTGKAVTGNRAAGLLLRALSNAQRRFQVRDPELRARVTPAEPMGCKRVLFTNDWYPALSRPDVRLVTEDIAEIEEKGVRTAGGELHELDALVYATGFDATAFLAPIRVTGRDGRTLGEAWRDGPYAYLGMTVPGFPNLFLMYGPNTNTGNTSVVYFHESQARYLVQAVTTGRLLEVRDETAARFDGEMQRRLAGSVWTGCRSWYRTAAGRIATNWPGMAAEYRRRTARLDPDDYLPSAQIGD